jgi:predicted alpha/beta-fold hydrolase
MHYAAPRWLPGGHVQTIYAATLAPRPRVAYRRERWTAPDGDFVEMDWLADPPAAGGTPATRPLVVLFHGLEGSSRSHYALALMAAVRNIGWRGCVMHFRGCGGEPNRLPRAYHSGDSAEVDWVLRRLRGLQSGSPLYAAGVSLGGNVLLKWLGESGAGALDVIARAAAVSAPLDLAACGNALGRGFNLAYAWHFLRTLKPKVLAKQARYPDLVNAARLRAALTMREFDDVFTAPLHGFRDVDDYWARASAKPLLGRIAAPTLIINARNDPFMPRDALPAPREVSPRVVLAQPEEGGHAGFVAGPFPGSLDWLPRRILAFFRDVGSPVA